MNRGFSVVEILITLVVMSILLTLGTVGMRSVLANGRDSERASDIGIIARGLEQRYNNGNSRSALPVGYMYWPDPAGASKGYYPGTNEIIHSQGGSRQYFTPEQVVEGYITENLPGTTIQSLTTPSGNELGQVCVLASCQPAGNAAQLNATFNNVTKGKDQYLYEAVNQDGTTICSDGGCTQFNLYWYSEVEQAIKTVKSKHK